MQILMSVHVYAYMHTHIHAYIYIITCTKGQIPETKLFFQEESLYNFNHDRIYKPQ